MRRAVSRRFIGISSRPATMATMGNMAAKEVVYQHLEHHNLYFRVELDSDHFFGTGPLSGTKRLESFRDGLAEGLLKAMKLFRLKQIGTAEWLGGQSFLSSPPRAIRI